MERTDITREVRIVIEANEIGDEVGISTDEFDDKLGRLLDDFEITEDSWDSEGLYEIETKITGTLFSEKSRDRYEPDYAHEVMDVTEDDIKEAFKDMPVTIYFYED